MFQRSAGLFLLSLMFASVFLTCTGWRTAGNRDIQEFSPAGQESSLSFVLEDENSPYFSRQRSQNQLGGLTEVLKYRADESEAHLVYDKDGKLCRIRAFRKLAGGWRLAYEGSYDDAGRRLLESCYYDAGGKPETELSRRVDGSEHHRFYRDGKLVQVQELAVDGACTTVTYENGIEKARDCSKPSSTSQELLFWDKERKHLRLKVELSGARLKSWQYFERTGKLEHTGSILADGSLEFVYAEDGKANRRQVWRLVGEDWERAYYGLFLSETYAADGKTVEHRVFVRSNGSLKKHERYNPKNGILEMQREFDLEGRVASVEEFKENGERKQVWAFPAGSPRSRGFVPDGMRRYPGGDEKNGYVYNLNGAPFQSSVLMRRGWAFFELGQ